MASKQVYAAKLSTRTKLHYIKTIRQKLSCNPDRLELFKSTVFGQWLNIKTYEHDNHLLHYLLQYQRFIENPNINTPMYFDIWGHTLEFGRQDMCLVLGFRFGDVSLEHLKKRQSGFGKRMLSFLRERCTEKISNIKAEQLFRVLSDQVEFNKLSNDDVVRLCLLLLLENIYMGKQERNVISNEILVLVDDIYAWNAFPWGEYIWVEFHKRIYNAVSKVRDRHLTESATKGDHYTATYTLCGFDFALKIWLIQRFEKTDYDLLFRDTEMVRLVPTETEMKELWWTSSVDYLWKYMPAGLYSDIPPSLAIDDTPAVNRSGRRIKMTPRRRGSVSNTDVHRNVDQDMPYVGDVMPPTATIMAQIAKMQLQINELHKYHINI